MKTTVSEAKQCPGCGKPLPAGPLAGLCPACLLAQGAETEPELTGAAARFQPPPLSEITRLFPQLEILGLLGAGGMGAVYKARQPALDRIVALKVLPSHKAEGVNFAERFNREARALARLGHPNIVAVFEFGQVGGEGGLHFFIMEFVDGANLRQLEQAGRLAPREALQIVPQICDALQYAHDEGVVHRDIKPENVLVDRKGRVKIADFGLAKILGQETESLRLTAEGQVMGTPHYMAPEQIERPLTVDHRADIYALGVVLYEMLTGDLPLGKFSPPSRKVQVDVRLDDVVLRALENDPSRRYQQASEVKSQVENIAGTPTQAAAPAASAPDGKFIRWAGFPVVVELEGVRKVNRKEAFKAFGILFGVLTIAFGIVTLITGRSLFGWVGIAGSLSLQMRLLIAALVTAFGVWRAFRSQPSSPMLPQTPQGTVILPPEGFSRKAVIGACWAPFFVVAALLYFMVADVTVGPARTTGQPVPSTQWWQILLSVTVLPLGLGAPFGTTILGWIAAGDIRRARGRISGLPLAVFDGLFFPLLALDGFLIWAWVTIVDGLQRQAVFEPFHAGEVSVLTKLGAAAICVLVDLWIIRRVWRAVRLDNPPAPRQGGDWWWSRKPAAITIGVTCALIIFAVAQRRETPPQLPPGIFKNAPQQVAAKDAATGALVAHLPDGGTMELLALSDAGAAPTEWWRPDGTPHAPTTFAVAHPDWPSGVNNEATVEKNVLFRFAGLPKDMPPLRGFGGRVFITGLDGLTNDMSLPIIECNPGTAYSAATGVSRNGRPLADAVPFRMAWPASVERVTMRLGVSLAPWRTVATYDHATRASETRHAAGDPSWVFSFQQTDESGGAAQLTVTRGNEDAKWQVRIVAVDTNGVAYSESGSTGIGTDGETTVTWTHTFDVPLGKVKEFRAQVLPLHWVEFRDVALQGRGLVERMASAPQFGLAQELTFADFLDFDTGQATGMPQNDDKNFNPFEVTPKLLAWMQQNGLDAHAGAGKLETLGVTIVNLDSGDWTTLTPDALRQRLREQGHFPTELRAHADGEPPATFGFRTREGGTGVLQLLGFGKREPVATVRFKMLEKTAGQ